MTPPGASHAHAASPLAPRRRPVVPPRPRRVSGPVRPAGPIRPPSPVARPERSAQGGLALGLIGLLGRIDALAGHRLLDRLIRSRVWIGIVAFALIGIVTLQLGLLKLNAGIGRALEREASLQRENAALSVENSELASGSRVEVQAEQLGMRLVSVGGLQFLGSRARSDVSRAAAALRIAPAHEAAVATTQATAGSAEASSHEAGEASSEGSGGEAASKSTPAGESTSASETRAASPAPGESATPNAGAEATGETSGEPVPAGVGGGAAAPGG